MKDTGISLAGGRRGKITDAADVEEWAEAVDAAAIMEVENKGYYGGENER